HRLVLSPDAELAGTKADDVITAILAEVPVPKGVGGRPVLVPRRPLLVAAALPVVLSAAGLPRPGLPRPLLLVDALLVVIAAADALWTLRKVVDVEVVVPEVLSLGRPSTVRAVLRSLSMRELRVHVDQDLFEGAVAPELPLDVTLPRR